MAKNMVTDTIPFDAARYLSDPAAQADFLRDAFETGDAGYIAHALGVTRALNIRLGASVLPDSVADTSP